MIIGYTGPKKNPPSVKRAIDTGSEGTTTAAMSAAEARATDAPAKATGWSRSAIREESRRPRVSPPHKSDRLAVAMPSGAELRNRTSQLETPTSDAT